VREHTAAVETLHVSATMPKAYPERVVPGFRQAERAVTSNTRCLTDVVDVPGVVPIPFCSDDGRTGHSCPNWTLLVDSFRVRRTRERV